MTKPRRFDNDAVEEMEMEMEMEMAAEWHEARRQDLGMDFVTAVREALQRVVDSPQTWPSVRDVPERLNVRRLLLRRFPSSVVFIELNAEIRVLAIAHTSREPSFWRTRL